MLNDIKVPPPDPTDPPPGRTPKVGPSVPAAAIIPGVAGPSPSIRPDEVTRAIDPTVPGSGKVPRNPLVQPHVSITPHADANGPGLHKTRVMGEPTHLDPEYATPMEDRGSFFSTTLSAVVVAVVAVLLLIVWWTFFRTGAAVTP